MKTKTKKATKSKTRATKPQAKPLIYILHRTAIQVMTHGGESHKFSAVIAFETVDAAKAFAEKDAERWLSWDERFEGTGNRPDLEPNVHRWISHDDVYNIIEAELHK